MLSPREIAQFNQVCAVIGDEVADERGFVAIRDLIKRFVDSKSTRPNHLHQSIEAHALRTAVKPQAPLGRQGHPLSLRKTCL
jgi:hypothetical protein